MGSQIKKADLSRPRKTLEAIYHKRLKISNLEGYSPYRRVGELLRGDWTNQVDDKRGFYEFLSSIARRRYYQVFYKADTLLNMYLQAKYWLKSPKDWTPENVDDSSEKLKQDLIQYLFVRYEVPQFMHKAWSDLEPLYIGWFIHLAQGHNIRTAPGMQAHLTKKMAHFFLQTPAEYDIKDALIYGQVMALGGNETLVKRLIALRIKYLFQDQEMWMALLRLFIKYPELKKERQIERIVSYLNAQRFARVFIDDYGQLGREEVKKFDLKGKTVNSLMREVKHWENANNYYDGNNQHLITWTPAKVRNFLYQANKADKRSPVYRIMQLTNNFAIQREGEVMRHCVGSYLERCTDGETSIWALTATTYNGVKPLLTIQVHKAKTIVQVRGKNNSMPTVENSNLVRQWAKREKLRIADYCELNQ